MSIHHRPLSYTQLIWLCNSVCIVSVIKAIYIFNSNEIAHGTIIILGCDSWMPQLIIILGPSFALTVMWSNIEFGTAIICGCLPTFRPLLRNWNFSWTRFPSRLGSDADGPRWPPSERSKQEAGHRKFGSAATVDDVILYNVDARGRLQSIS